MGRPQSRDQREMPPGQSGAGSPTRSAIRSCNSGVADIPAVAVSENIGQIGQPGARLERTGSGGSCPGRKRRREGQRDAVEPRALDERDRGEGRDPEDVVLELACENFNGEFPDPPAILPDAGGPPVAALQENVRIGDVARNGKTELGETGQHERPPADPIAPRV